MTGLEKIMNYIQEDAQEAVNCILNEADEKAENILNEAKAECKKMEDETNAKIESISENTASRSDSAAQMQKKRILLEARQEIISDCIERAHSSLKNLNDDEYFKLMEQMLAKFVLPQDGILYFSETDLKRLPQNFEETVKKIAADNGGSLSISEDCRDVDGGFIIAYGGIEENCSFKALFDDSHEKLQDIVRNVLFPD